ncbi:transposase [Flavobacterium sp.]|uniref:transposase n=2 Tax=Flavobacterium sp. TaxID=239 RepID=UPI00404717AE
MPKIISLFRNIITFNAMQNKFQNKYRIPFARLQTWDYANNGAYFITICTQNREHFFGQIKNKEMRLSEIGKLAAQFWYEIPNHFPMVELGNFVVMPNHVHGILIIDNSQTSVETRLIASLQGGTGGFSGDKNPMICDSISKIVRWYKGRCSFEFRQINPNFGWQSRFHDHIIRNSKSFDTIQNYIEQNPLKWKEDTFYKL